MDMDSDEANQTIPEIDEATRRHSSRRWRAFVLTLIVVIATGIGIVMWVSDFLTLEGEWTVYTASCDGGTWQGDRCSGQLQASDRFRFRTLKAHREVLFWTVQSTSGESGRYTQCDIRDNRNWKCPANDHVDRTITHQMSRGLPTPEATGGAHMGFHRVPKWKWQALKVGIPVGQTASN